MRSRRLAALVAPAALAVALLSSCGSDEETATPEPAAEETGGESMGGESSTPEGADAVAIKGFKFTPAELTVEAGTELTVTNEDDAAHTLTAKDGSFDTGNLDGGDSGSITVDEPGEHEFFCEIHQYMRGSITVE